MNKRRTLLQCLLVCCLMCAGCSWLQNEFFSMDRAAPEEPPHPELRKGTGPAW